MPFPPAPVVGHLVAQLTALRELALPRACCGCAAPATWWCPDCARALAAESAWRGSVAGVPAAAAAPHDGVARQLMLGFKQRGVTAVAPHVAELLVVAATVAAGPAPWQVVRVPPAPGSRLRRGFDPVAELCRAAAVSGPPLHWSRRSTGQKRLGRADRIRNRAHALVAPPALRDVVVVDDVMTTGATLGEAVRAVRAAGGTVRAVAAVTHAPPGPVTGPPVGRLGGARD